MAANNRIAGITATNLLEPAALGNPVQLNSHPSILPTVKPITVGTAWFAIGSPHTFMEVYFSSNAPGLSTGQHLLPSFLQFISPWQIYQSGVILDTEL